MAEIVVKISRKDPTRIETEVEGMKGQGCTAMLDAFQTAVKLTTQRQQLKPEYRDAKVRLQQGRK